jgi:hypothetical protein
VQVLAKALREAAQAELGGAVERRAGRRDLPRQGVDEHDVPAPACCHPHRQGSRHEDRRAQVDVERRVDPRRVEAVEPPARRQRGVGHEHVDVRGPFDQAVDRPAIGEVDREHLRVELAREAAEHLRLPTREHQLGVSRRERPRDRVTDPTGGTGDQRRSTLELHGAPPFPCHGPT